MYRYTVTKYFDCAMGHRIYNQKLDPEYSNNSLSKCLNLHGHNAGISVTLTSPCLDDCGMVIDFNEFKKFKKEIIDGIMDHHTLLFEQDPFVQSIISQELLHGQFKLETIHKIPDIGGLPDKFYTISKYVLNDVGNGFLHQLLNGIYVTNFTTTSEKLAEWLFCVMEQDLIQYNKKYNKNVHVLKVEYKETDGSTACFSVE